MNELMVSAGEAARRLGGWLVYGDHLVACKIIFIYILRKRESGSGSKFKDVLPAVPLVKHHKDES